jgi:CO/xanthine dehydrogenase FAD-binding subunit
LPTTVSEPRIWERDMSADYIRPPDLEHVLSAGSRPGAVYLAGGTDLLIPGNPRRERASLLVSLRDIAEMRTIERLPDGRTLIGAAATHAQLAADPHIQACFAALAEACGSVGSAPIRAAATVGGNLCNAVPSADAATPLLLYDATVILRRCDATRELPLPSFITGPGETALHAGELLLGIKVTPSPRRTSGSAFRKISRRAAVDIALASASALVELEQGACVRLVLALGAVAPTAIVVDSAEAAACGRALDDVLLDTLADMAEAAARPITDIRASADYRRKMVRVIVRSVTAEAWRRALAREERGLEP